MKKILLLLLSVLAIFGTKNVYASHAAGCDLIYEHVPNTTDQYKVTYKFYRYCGQNNASAPNQATLCVSNSCGFGSQTFTMPKVAGPIIVSTGCPGYPNSCNGGTTPGYEEHVYEVIVDLAALGATTTPNSNPCNSWKFSANVCCRNPNINTLQTPGGQQIYAEATLNNILAPNDSSPFFSNKPIPYCCINQIFNYNNGAIDPNNDSLFFESIQPLTGSGCPASPSLIPYATGYAPALNPVTNPIQTNSTFNLNQNTGAAIMTPSQVDIGVFTIRCSSYRNGQLVGYVMRDIQIIVLNCNTPSPDLSVDSFSIVGGSLVNGQVQGCAGDSIYFCFNAYSSDTAGVLIPSDNSAVSAPGATITYTGVLTDSITGCLAWQTTVLDTGLHVLTISIKDSSCAPPGVIVSNTFSIPIFINPITEAFKDTSICVGDTVDLQVYGGSLFNWGVLPGGSPISSMSDPTVNNPQVWPNQTTTYYVTSNLTSVCPQNSDTVTITVAEGPTLTLATDTTTCVNSTLQLDLDVNPPGNYTYVWTPGTYLNNATVQDPIVQNPQADITYIVQVIPSNVTACSSYDTINVRVLDGFDLDPYSNILCDGESVNISGTGHADYTYNWSPGGGLSSTNTINTTITPTPAGTYSYTITASYPGCPDSSQTVTLTVDENPTVFAGSDREICYNDTVHLQSSVSPPGNYTIEWIPNADLDNATIDNPVWSGTQTAAMTVRYTTPNGCEGTDDMIISVVPANFLVIDGDRTICPNESTSLSIQGGVAYNWYPDYRINTTSGGSVIVDPKVTTTYSVIGTDIKGCVDTASAIVVVSSGSVVDAGDDVTIYPGESVRLFAAGNCSIYNWFPPSGLSSTTVKDPMARPTATTKYIVNAETENGCPTSDSVIVRVSDESIIDLPNVFSPGSGTSLNDRLKIVKRGIVELQEFVIYNRWGMVVYSSKDIEEGWDGRYNGEPQPLGAYVYRIKATTSTGKVFTKQGNVTLIR